MRLKDIKPGMAIYCTTREQIAEIRKTGIKGLAPMNIELYMTPPCYVVIRRNYATYTENIENMKVLYPDTTICEFSDLTRTELSAAEVLEICHKICRKNSCAGCALEGNCFAKSGCDFGKVVEICEQWESEQEEKEPEFEWVDMCRIIKIHESGRKECVEEIPLSTGDSESFSEWQLKEYCKEHEGDYIAVVERVCRVKQ